VTSRLAAEGLTVQVGDTRVVDDLRLALAPGQVLGLLGRNGVGKTTLLHTLAGVRAPRSGQVALCGRDFRETPGREVARLRGLLTQGLVDAFPASVLETVLIGRHPHLGRWDWEGSKDLDLARAALAAVGLAGFEARPVQQLSGGERQRVAIATLLCQQPSVYLLDEPLAHLDLNHQMAVLALLRTRAAGTDGLAPAVVVMVLHDVNLAARFCDEVLLLFGDGVWQHGPVVDIMRAEPLSALLGHPLRRVEVDGQVAFIPA